MEAAAVWTAGTASVTISNVGADLDLAGALAMARELGASGWAAAELLTALRLGMAEGAATRRAEETTCHGRGDPTVTGA